MPRIVTESIGKTIGVVAFGIAVALILSAWFDDNAIGYFFAVFAGFLLGSDVGIGRLANS